MAHALASRVPCWCFWIENLIFNNQHELVLQGSAPGEPPHMTCLACSSWEVMYMTIQINSGLESSIDGKVSCIISVFTCFVYVWSIKKNCHVIWVGWHVDIFEIYILLDVIIYKCSLYFNSENLVQGKRKSVPHQESQQLPFHANNGILDF